MLLNVNYDIKMLLELDLYLSYLLFISKSAPFLKYNTNHSQYWESECLHEHEWASCTYFS